MIVILTLIFESLSGLTDRCSELILGKNMAGRVDIYNSYYNVRNSRYTKSILLTDYSLILLYF